MSLLLLLLASPALAQPAPAWTEYHREYAEVRAYRVLRTEADGVREVMLRTACLPGLKETWSCEAVLEIYRKLSVLAMPRQVTFTYHPPKGGERPSVTERLSGYAIDCKKEAYAPLSIEWRGAKGQRVTRIEYPGRGWRPLEKIELLGKQVCG